MNRWRVRVYKDRTGKWRWRLQAPNGKIIGASTESYEQRKWCLVNLTACTGIYFTVPRGKTGDIWKQFQLLGQRTMVS